MKTVPGTAYATSQIIKLVLGERRFYVYCLSGRRLIKKASSIDCKSSGVFKGAMATHSGKDRDVSTNQHTEMNLGHRAPDKLPIAQKKR